MAIRWSDGISHQLLQVLTKLLSVTVPGATLASVAAIGRPFAFDSNGESTKYQDLATKKITTSSFIITVSDKTEDLLLMRVI
jgi:hypothetical protein